MDISSEGEQTKPRKYKFLRRNITLSNSKVLMTTIKLKKLHFKKITSFGFQTKMKYYLTPKQTCCLRSLIINGTKPSKYFLTFLRNLKTLKQFKLTISGRKSLQNVSPCLKRLSKDIEAVDLCGSSLDQDNHQLQSIYKALAAFTKLKELKKAFCYHEGNPGCMKMDYRLTNRYLSRLKKLTEFDLNFYDVVHSDLQAMKLNQVCPAVTGLSFAMCYASAEDYTAIQDRLEEDTSEDDYEEAKQDQDLIHQDQLEMLTRGDVNIILPVEDELLRQLSIDIAQFFRFSRLPNLKKLALWFYEDYLFPFDPLIETAFESLNKLKHLELNFQVRPKGTNALLKGLMHLPLLKKFCLWIPFLKPTEYSLLTQFLKKQTQLVHLSLEFNRCKQSKITYQYQNLFLENINQCLKNKPYLKYFALRSLYSNLESISKGLAKTGALDSIEEIRLDVFDDFVTGSLSSAHRVEGLCDFMRRHSHSLRSLMFNLWFIIDDDIIDNIFEVISELDQLKSLSIHANYIINLATISEYEEFFQEQFSQDMRGIIQNRDLTFHRTFHVLNETLKKLTKLCDINIDLQYLMKDRALNNAFDLNSSNIFSTLTNLYELKYLNLTLPLLEQDLESHPERISFIERLANMTIASIISDNYKAMPKVERILQGARQRNRCSLLF